MLVLSRQKDESIMIGDDIEVCVVDIRGDKIRLGINAPREVSVHRKEIWLAIKREQPKTQPTSSQEMESESFGPVMNPNGSMGDTTKAFARGNTQYVYAEIKIPPHIDFPYDMLKYDACEVLPEYGGRLETAYTGQQRFIVVRRLRSSSKKWSPDRWRSFSCSIEVISGDIRSRPDSYIPRKSNHT